MKNTKKRAKAPSRRVNAKRSSASRKISKTVKRKAPAAIRMKMKKRAAAPIVRTKVKIKDAAPTKKERGPTIKANIFPSEEVKAALDRLSTNESAVNFLKKNVSKRVLDVLNLLDTPKTDEDIAAKLDMKINAVRRILNMMQDHGVTNYYISKNVNGWLSFAWYINVSKFPPFFEYISGLEAKTTIVNDQCNDYFVCNKCYDQNRLIFTFESAFEEGFKCVSCGSGLTMINKDDATKLVSVQTVQV